MKTELLDEFIMERTGEPFAWGSNDCCLFGADWIMKLRGVDLAEGFRGRYFSALGAYRLIRPGGVVGRLEDAAGRLGMAEIATAYAQRGDLALVDMGGHPGVGVVVFGGVASPGSKGLVIQKLNDAKRVWRT